MTSHYLQFHLNKLTYFSLLITSAVQNFYIASPGYTIYKLPIQLIFIAKFAKKLHFPSVKYGLKRKCSLFSVRSSYT